MLIILLYPIAMMQTIYDKDMIKLKYNSIIFVGILAWIN